MSFTIHEPLPNSKHSDFGKLDDEEIHRQCETLMQESGWTHGADAVRDSGCWTSRTGCPGARVFSPPFARGQVEQYNQKTKDPETVRPAAQELLKLWAND
jgi:hypothetical protein